MSARYRCLLSFVYALLEYVCCFNTRPGECNGQVCRIQLGMMLLRGSRRYTGTRSFRRTNGLVNTCQCVQCRQRMYPSLRLVMLYSRSTVMRRRQLWTLRRLEKLQAVSRSRRARIHRLQESLDVTQHLIEEFRGLFLQETERRKRIAVELEGVRLQCSCLRTPLV